MFSIGANANAIANQLVIRNPDGRLMLVVDTDNVVLTTGKLKVNSYVRVFDRILRSVRTERRNYIVRVTLSASHSLRNLLFLVSSSPRSCRSRRHRVQLFAAVAADTIVVFRA